MYVSTPKKTSFSVILHLLLYEFYSINLGFSSVSLVCQPMSKMSATDRSAFVGWLLDYLVGWMAVVTWWVGCVVTPGWLAAWEKVDVANWMQIDLLCFSQIEATIF